jgi:hypothetical protein
MKKAMLRGIFLAPGEVEISLYRPAASKAKIIDEPMSLSRRFSRRGQAPPLAWFVREGKNVSFTVSWGGTICDMTERS